MTRKPVSAMVVTKGDQRFVVLTYANGDVVKRKVQRPQAGAASPRRRLDSTWAPLGAPGDPTSSSPHRRAPLPSILSRLSQQRLQRGSTWRFADLSQPAC